MGCGRSARARDCQDAPLKRSLPLEPSPLYLLRVT
jgi:hypothetical protein